MGKSCYDDLRFHEEISMKELVSWSGHICRKAFHRTERHDIDHPFPTRKRVGGCSILTCDPLPKIKALGLDVTGTLSLQFIF